LAGQAAYKQPDTLTACVKYGPANILEDGEWFYIDNFSEKDYCLSFLVDDNLNGADYVEIDKINPEHMDYLVSYQNRMNFYFQRVFKHTVIQNKKYLHIGAEVEIKEEKNAVELSEVPDAVYLKLEDRLYFRKLETISVIFKGIDQLYHEATDDEVKSFLENDFVKLENEFSVDHVKKANRKRIALAISTLEKFDESQKREFSNIQTNTSRI